MDDELAIIEAKNLIDLIDLAFNKKSERDRSLRKNENLQTHSVVRQNDKDLPHNSSHHVGSDPSLTFNKDLHKIAQAIVRNELEKFEENVDAKFVEMKGFMDSAFKHIIEELKSLQNEVSTNKDVDVEWSNKMKEISCEESKDSSVNEKYIGEKRTVLKERLCNDLLPSLEKSQREKFLGRKTFS
ncbi:hypothetical protein KY285_030307 [Solanum tuberosum]|nr:hypothetical protein KY285_030307 [Solanum tuberosum]